MKERDEFPALRKRAPSWCSDCARAASREAQARLSARRRKCDAPPARERKCSRCCETKPANAFTKNRGNKDGLQAYCKPCNATWANNKRRLDPSVQQRQNELRKEKWRHYRDYNKILYHKRILKIRLDYTNNKERYKANANRRRGRIKECEGSHSKADILSLFEAQGGMCSYCRRDVFNSYHVDHKTPIARGGSNWPSNLQITCSECNLQKGVKTHEEFVAFAI